MTVGIRAFLISILAAFCINLPALFVHDTLLPGDAGYSLYVFDAINRGQLPYRDFWWVYGPLMLYYNALFFKVFGSCIQTAMWAQLLLKTISAGAFFLAAHKIMPRWAAILAAMAFAVFTPNFIHNFSHYGGVCMEAFILWTTLSYFHNPDRKYIYWNALFIILFGFIKINFGVLFLFGTTACFIICDLFRPKRFIFKNIVLHGVVLSITIIIWSMVYFFFLHDLSLAEIGQSFPLFKPYAYFGGSSAYSLGMFCQGIVTHITTNNLDLMIFIVAVSTALRIFFHMAQRRSCSTIDGRNGALILVSLLILMIIGYHEYFKGRLDYQAYWAQPFVVMVLAYLISEACLVSRAKIYTLVLTIMAVFVAANAYQNWKSLERYKDAGHYFDFNRIGIFVSNDPMDIQSMLDTARYIDKNIPKNSLFYSTCNDELYYYLANRQAPYRLLSLYMALHLEPAQENNLITSLETKNVQYVIMSSQCYRGGDISGVLGKNYGFIIDRYIKDNYREIARFGRWHDNDPSIYIGGIGTRIFRKKYRPKG